MTLADYSLSNVVFDKVDKWKNTLEYLVESCNETETLGAMIPQLEEFVDVARSESKINRTAVVLLCECVKQISEKIDCLLELLRFNRGQKEMTTFTSTLKTCFCLCSVCFRIVVCHHHLCQYELRRLYLPHFGVLQVRAFSKMSNGSFL